MLNSIAPPSKRLDDPEKLKLFRGFLGITQARLAQTMGTTQTSVGRWEAGITPISSTTMRHVRELVTAKIKEETTRLFTDLLPKLTLSEFAGLFGNPDAGFTEDADGNLYLGSVFMEGYRQHSLHIRLNDEKWYGLDRDAKATRVDEGFLQTVISHGKALEVKP